MPKTIIQRTIS